MFCYNTYRIEQHEADEDRATEEQEAADRDGITVEELRDRMEDAKYDRYQDALE